MPHEAKGRSSGISKSQGMQQKGICPPSSLNEERVCRVPRTDADPWLWQQSGRKAMGVQAAGGPTVKRYWGDHTDRVWSSGVQSKETCQLKSPEYGGALHWEEQQEDPVRGADEKTCYGKADLQSLLGFKAIRSIDLEREMS